MAIEALDLAIKRSEGNLGASPTSKTVIAGIAARADVAESGKTMLELFERYAAHRVTEDRKRSTGIAQDRMVVTLFAEFVGKARSIPSITAEDAREFWNTAAQLPLNYTKRIAYRGLGMRAAADKAKRENEKLLSPMTSAWYLSQVSPFFDWLRSEPREADSGRVDLKYLPRLFIRDRSVIIVVSPATVSG